MFMQLIMSFFEAIQMILQNAVSQLLTEWAALIFGLGF